MIERVEAGAVVVLVSEDAAEVGVAVAEAEAEVEGARVAAFVGRRDDPALAEMTASLFRETPGS